MISSLLPQFGFTTRTFFTGEFCGSSGFVPQEVGHLHFVRRGPVRMVHDDGSSIEAVEPTLVFYPRPYAHRLIVEPGTQAELVCADVSFKGGKKNPLALALPPFMAIPISSETGVGKVIDLLCSEALAKEQEDRFVLDRLCEILVFQIIQLAIRNNLVEQGVLAGFTDPGIAKALLAVHHQPGNDWTLQRLASVAAMSRSKFAVRFRSLVGVTPARYLSDWRLTTAEQMLGQKLSVNSVAAAVGYRTHRSFTRAFTERNGVSPTEWVRRNE